MEITSLALASLEKVGRAANAAASSYEFDKFNAKLAESTKVNYCKALDMFRDLIEELAHVVIMGDLMYEAEAWRGVTYGLVLAFQKSLVDKGYSAASVNVRVAGVKTYARVAHQAGIIPSEEYYKIRLLDGVTAKRDKQGKVSRSKFKGARKNEPIFLTEGQMEVLKSHPDTPVGRRDAVLMCIFLDHGLRLSEALGLQVENVDLAKGVFTFYRQKVKLTQTHRMTKDTLRAMAAYLKHDRKVASGPLFVSSRQGRLTKYFLTRSCTFALVRQFGRDIGIDNLSPHDLRHSWTRRAVDHGTPLEALKDGGGWSSLDMPGMYIGHSKIANEHVNLGL